MIRGAADDAPNGPDREGVGTAGQVEDAAGFRLGFVLIGPETGEERMASMEGRLPAWRPAAWP
jgi:hypothetical protein